MKHLFLLTLLCLGLLVSIGRCAPVVNNNLAAEQQEQQDQPQNGPHIEGPKGVPNNVDMRNEHQQPQKPAPPPPAQEERPQQVQPQQPLHHEEQPPQKQTQPPTPAQLQQQPRQPPVQQPVHHQQQQQQQQEKPYERPKQQTEEPKKEPHVLQERSPLKAQKVGDEEEQQQPQHHEDRQQQQMQQAPPRPNVMQTLANDPRCKTDLDNIITKKGICAKNVLTSNILILDCLQNNLNEETEGLLSTDCHNAIWDIKDHLTTDEAVHDTIRTQCSDVIEQLPECKSHIGQPGKLLSCLIEHSDAVHDLEPRLTAQGTAGADKFKNCNTLLVRLSSIVFSDYRLIEGFLKDCKTAITEFNCGHSLGSAQNVQRLTSQDETINCLRQHYRDIKSKECKHEILRLAELQADDYHLNRALFYACRVDREKFCAKVEAGHGRVYQCLIEHKTAPEMTTECKSQLVNEQELAQEDYRIDVTFARKCNDDLQKFKCLPSPNDNGRVSNEVLMSDIIHCLVSAEREQQGSVSHDCLAAVHSVSRQIMEDFKISPSIVSQCKDEIYSYCNNNLDRDGSTLQCLLKNARKAKRNKLKGKVAFSEGCLNELQEILEDADLEHDYTVDPTLVQHCSVVIEENCKQFTRTGSAVLGCLLEHLGTPTLQEHPECAERVLALYYFVSRNWRLDTSLYQACKSEAVKRCGAKADHKWHEGSSKKDESTTKSRVVLSCLYNNAVSAVRARFQDDFKDFPKACVQAISRVMRQRAMDVSLLPEIEDKCMADLAQHCSHQTGVGDEMRCLQESFKTLSQDCQKAVRDIMKGSETLDLRIDDVLNKACQPMMEHFCQAELEQAANGEPDAAMAVLDCLVKNKQNNEMNEACAVAIEHHQILQIEDITLNPRFAAACQRDATRYCGRKQKAHEVLWCLSEIIRNDTLRGSGNFRISEQCRERVRFEFFAEMDNVELDPELSTACGTNINMFCANEKHRTFDCLKENWEQLTFNCRGILFQRVQMEAIQGINVALRSRCERMMNRFCKEVAPHEMIDCLIESMAANNDFDNQCRQLVMRAQETKAKDVRLNPSLLMKCSADLMKYCSKHMPNPFSTLLESGDIGDGKALGCLRKVYANESAQLNDDCAREVNRFIRESKSNYKQDLLLARNCKKEIENYCSLVSESQVEDCLKRSFFESFRELPNHKVMSQECIYQIARILGESKADVQTDGELFGACQGDIGRLCAGPPGRGRVMGCLLSQVDHNVPLSPKCREMLELRREMWSYAARQSPPEKIADVVNLVNDSPVRTTVLVFLVVAVVSSILIGVVCGRISKRVRTDMKNR